VLKLAAKPSCLGGRELEINTSLLVLIALWRFESFLYSKTKNPLTKKNCISSICEVLKLAAKPSCLGGREFEINTSLLVLIALWRFESFLYSKTKNPLTKKKLHIINL